MINLLSQAQKELLWQEYRARRRITAGGFCLGLLLMSLVLSSLTLSQIKIRQNETLAALRQVRESNQTDISAGLREATNAVKIATAGANREPLAALQVLVTSLAPSTIAITEWEWQSSSADTPATIGLSGEATDRQSLLNFISQLESLEQVTKVESPITNLIKGRGSKFSIEITLKSYGQ